MATIKSYTNREQSKKLAEFLSLESADMNYQHFVPDLLPEGYCISVDKVEYETDIPCWSLAALLNVLEFPKLEKDNIGDGKIGWMVSVYPNNCRYDSIWHDNPIDACVEMIVKLHELKLL